MAIQKIWINNSTGNDSTGDGSSGSPYASFQGALDHGSLPTDGRAILAVRTGTAYSGANNTGLNFTTSGNPSATAPLWFVGVENTSEDDPTSLVEVDCGSASFMNQPSAGDYITFANLSFHNDGTTFLMDVDNNCVWINCEFYFDSAKSGSQNLLNYDTNIALIGCYFHDVNNAALIGGEGVFGYRCLFIEETGDNGSHSLGSGISMMDVTNYQCWVQCAFKLTSTNGNIMDRAAMSFVIDCSFYDDNASGATRGCLEQNVNNVVLNCIFDGWNGTGGECIDSNEAPPSLWRRVWYKDGPLSSGEDPAIKKDNTSLTLAPFSDAANDDFTPEDNVDGMKEVTWPSKIGGTAAP